MSKKRIRCTIVLSLSLFLLLCTAPTDAFKYTGYGANRTVSGSMHLLEIGNENILLDAGSFYDREGEEEGRYDGEFIASISAIIISHAHTDHLGNLSKIVNMGYEGKIYCTEPTAALMPTMLEMAKIWLLWTGIILLFPGKRGQISKHRCPYLHRLPIRL
jgi:predicted metal-dependent RNase